MNSIPLSEVLDAGKLIGFIEEYGINAELEPLEKVIARNNEENNKSNSRSCDWMAGLKNTNHDLVLQVLQAMQPSVGFSGLIQTLTDNLRASKSSVNGTLSNGICLHHRDGLDWHEHCNQWETIKDGVWRKNCMNDRKLPLVDLVIQRNPEMYKSSWIYYVGDYKPPDTMLQEFKNQSIDLLHRKKYGLLTNEDIAKTLGLPTISEETHRDLFAVIDFFVCSEIEAFIGNSVSTFSANQIAIRRGINSSWYNSRGIPLADYFNVFQIPIVYTYTEESEEMGQSLLKASILSVRGVFGLSIPINILYHGTKDVKFMDWLRRQDVIEVQSYRIRANILRKETNM